MAGFRSRLSSAAPCRVGTGCSDSAGAIAPGAVLVPDEYDAAERDRLARTTPLARLGRPEDAVAALLYLLEGGDYVTGEVLVVDGGRLLR